MKYKNLFILMLFVTLPSLAFSIEEFKGLILGKSSVKTELILEKGKSQLSDYEKDKEKLKNLFEKRDFQEILNFAKEVKEKYKDDIKPYSYLLAEIASAFSSYDFSNKNQYLYSIEFAKNVLQNSDLIPLELEYRMVSHLQGRREYYYEILPDSEWAKDREERIKYLLHLWKRFDNNIDRKFDLKDPKNRPLGSICVPAPNYFCGIRPEDVKESDVRARYIALIEANTEKAKKYNLQLQLQRLDKKLPDFVNRFLVNFYSNPPFADDELDKHFADFGIVGKHKEETLKAITEAKEKKEQKNDAKVTS